MKLTSLSSVKAIGQIPQLGLKLKSGLLAVTILFASASIRPVLAADRVVQVLGRCGPASAQYIGSRKHSELVSFGPDGEAGISIDGVEGKTISELRGIFIAFEPPKVADTYTFVLRIKVAGEKLNRVQNFTVGPDSNPNLPNIPTRDDIGDGVIQSANINTNDLIVEGSKLTGNDVIKKVSFLFSCNKKNSKQTLLIEQVAYGGLPIYLLLEPVTCNLK